MCLSDGLTDGDAAQNPCTIHSTRPNSGALYIHTGNPLRTLASPSVVLLSSSQLALHLTSAMVIP